MKELSIEEKAKRYDEAIERANELNYVSDKNSLQRKTIEHIFPELRESEDDRIRKEMIETLKNEAHEFPSSIIAEKSKSWIAWLEKQGELKPFNDTQEYLKGVDRVQNYEELTKFEKGFDRIADTYAHNKNKEGYNSPWYTKERAAEMLYWAKEELGLIERQGEKKPTDKVEPKFKVGDWVVNTVGDTNRVVKVLDDGYTLDDNTFLSNSWATKHYHLWSIEDAKDGDVLSYVTEEEDLWIMIYWSLYEPYDGHVHYHALLVKDDFIDKGTCCICIDDLKPATKEQHSLLFKKMHEAGYEWDAEKKKLRKIEQKPVEWSEEDKNRFNNLIFLVECSDENELTKKGFIDFINRLKSLRSQSHWKPSNEEVEALANALSLAKNCGEESAFDLCTLYEQLKKLRREQL